MPCTDCDCGHSVCCERELGLIRCVMFDLGNVLVLYNTPLFYSRLESRKRNETPVREILDGKYRSAFVDFELGKISAGEFFDRTRYTLQLDMSFEEFMSAFIENGIMTPDPVMLELKRGLKERGMKLILVTNNNPAHMEFLRRNYPEVMYGFDFEAISHEMRMRKPDNLKIFIRPMEFFGLGAENCLFIDDNKQNVDAFRKLGGLGYHYNVVDKHLGVRVDSVIRERRHLIAMCKNLGLINGWPEI